MPAKLERRTVANRARERDRVVDARHADAMHAEVELDVDADGAIRASRAAAREIVDRLERVERDRHVARVAGSCASRRARAAPTGG